MESYLGTAWGESIQPVTLQDVRSAIVTIQKADEEHGGFWVASIEEDETVLETHKDLTVIGVFPKTDDQEIRAQMRNWNEVEQLYNLFLACDFEEVKRILKKA